MRPDLLSHRGPTGPSTSACALRLGAPATVPGQLAHDRLVVASQPTLRGHTPCVSRRGWRGAAPPLTLRFRPATGAGGGEVLQPPSPVAGATVERSPVVADDPADVILNGPLAGRVGRDRPGLEDPPVGGSLADSVAAIQARSPRSPENRSHGHSVRSGGGLAESEAVGSPVAHELGLWKGRSTPGFRLPAKELDILAGEDRGTETGGGVALDG